MNITVRYLGMLAEKVGKNSEELKISETETVAQVRSDLVAKYAVIAGVTFKVAVNNQMKSEDFVIPNDAEVALLPPFSGG